ncbi:MAG: hypothetical protein FWH03_00685 [Firmicutes bacterium]|nr:hypothetical protein [Bacillota bacterium]
MINRDYSFLLSDIESVYSLVVSMISGADKQRFEQLYRRLPSPNQKLFLAQLFMPSCTARGTDNRLTYYRSSIQLLPGKTEISFQEKSEIELEMLYREYLCYLGDEGNEVRKQLRILANELLTLIMEKLQISVRPNVLNDIRLKVAI